MVKTHSSSHWTGLSGIMTQHSLIIPALRITKTLPWTQFKSFSHAAEVFHHHQAQPQLVCFFWSWLHFMITNLWYLPSFPCSLLSPFPFSYDYSPKFRVFSHAFTYFFPHCLFPWLIFPMLFYYLCLYPFYSFVWSSNTSNIPLV